MAELKRPLKNRGFYVKMKLPKHPRLHEKSFFLKYYKWVLWFSLSVYFFSSFLITNHKPNSSKPHGFLSKSRVLIESVNDSVLLQSQKFQGLKVFVYDLPAQYNVDWLSNRRCQTHLFAAEVAIHIALLNSDVRTFNPYDADLYFVPVYVACNFSSVNGFPAIAHARSLLSSSVHLISSEYPFWNRSSGSNHVFVASHDYGACFHAMEDRAMAEGIPDFLKNSIILQTFGVNYKHPCQNVNHILIPPYISPENVEKTLQLAPVTGKRDIWVFFRGKMEVHPKNISGRFYSKKVRTSILKNYGNDRRFFLKRHRFAGYQSEIARSIFCLCPLGWAPWSPRLVESVALGCIPVIIADGIKLPFPSAVAWPEISLTVLEKDVHKLGVTLEHVASTNLSAIQRNLWDPAIRRAILFNKEVKDGDATWQVLRSLTEKLSMSRERAGDLSQ